MYSFGQFCRVFCFFVFCFFLKCGPVFQDSPRVFNYVLIIITSRVSSQDNIAEKNLHKEFDVFSNISIYGVLVQFL